MDKCSLIKDTTIDTSQLDELEVLLRESGHEIYRSKEQILVRGKKNNRKMDIPGGVYEFEWDAVCNKYSYGHKDGLIEVMGPIIPQKEPYNVRGYLTAKEVFELLKEHENK